MHLNNLIHLLTSRGQDSVIGQGMCDIMHSYKIRLLYVPSNLKPTGKPQAGSFWIHAHDLAATV